MIINCNGLKSSSKSTQFQALLDIHVPDFILGTESKLQNIKISYSIFPSNYTIFRKDRNRHGGGVFQAIKSDLVCVEKTEFTNNCEIIWTSLKISTCKTLYLSSVYRPPNSTPEILDCIQESINRVFTKSPNHPNVIIGGDFNLGDIDWTSEAPVPCNTNSNMTTI
jgi:exonuclease III